MNKFLASMATLSAATALTTVPAKADHFLSAPGNYTASGTVQLYQTIPDFFCVINAGIRVDAEGKAFLTSLSFSPGNDFCGSLVRPLAPPPGDVPISHGVPGVDQVDISFPVNIQAGAGVCVGTLSSKFTLYWGTKGPNRIASNPVASVVGATPPCTLTGSLSVTPVAPTTGELRL